MKPLKFMIVLVVITSLIVLALEQREIRRCREINRELKLQLSQITADYNNTPESAGKPSATAPTTEILKARGQLSAMRGQKAEAGQLSEENKKLRLHRYNDLLQGDRLKPAEVAAYLQAKQRSADSLLAAYKATDDATLLREAMEKNPADPHIQFAAYACFGKDMSPEERRACLDAFKKAAPDNALSGYLSAREYFKAGQSELAVQEVMKAAGNPKFDNYAADDMRSTEEVYAAAGFTELESKWLSTSSATYNYLADLKGLGKSMTELADGYRKAGDDASAQSATQMAIALGQRLDDASSKSCIIQDLVGFAIERSILKGMNPSAAYDNSGRTAQQRLDEINQRMKAIKAVEIDDFSSLLQSIPEPDQLEYLERLKTSGEFAARTWLKSKQSKP